MLLAGFKRLAFWVVRTTESKVMSNIRPHGISVRYVAIDIQAGAPRFDQAKCLSSRTDAKSLSFDGHGSANSQNNMREFALWWWAWDIGFGADRIVCHRLAVWPKYYGRAANHIGRRHSP